MNGKEIKCGTTIAQWFRKLKLQKCNRKNTPSKTPLEIQVQSRGRLLSRGRQAWRSNMEAGRRFSKCRLHDLSPSQSQAR